RPGPGDRERALTIRCPSLGTPTPPSSLSGEGRVPLPRTLSQPHSPRGRENEDGLVDLQEKQAAAATAAASPAIHCVELTRRFGKVLALAGLTMTVPRGEVFGFLGPNGAGKTTGVKLLVGLVGPTSGEAWVLGRPLGDLRTRARIGYLPELFRYQPWLSGREVLGVHCELAGLARSTWNDEVAEALRTVGLADRGDDRVNTYSKGMQQ